MTWVQLSIPRDVYKEIKVEKAQRELGNLNDTVLEILQEYFENKKKRSMSSEKKVYI